MRRETWGSRIVRCFCVLFVAAMFTAIRVWDMAWYFIFLDYTASLVILFNVFKLNRQYKEDDHDRG